MKEKKYKIGIIGIGMVGAALRRYFESKPAYQVKLYCYDKKGIGSMEEVNKADFIYICLPTPYLPDKGCDISILENALEGIKGKKVIVIKSTILPGTTDAFQEKYSQHRFIFNPEFLTESTADNDMRFPDRQIIGYTKESYTIAKDIALQLPLAPYERIVPARVAEMIKYANNTWFAVKVAKNNELYDLAKKEGFTEKEWEDVVSGLAADKRVERTHLTVYHKKKRGYWGKCLPKDTKAFLEFARKRAVKMPVLEATDTYNDQLLEQQGLKKWL